MPIPDAVSGIIILNIVIGIAQELKAKKFVDELTILNQQKPWCCATAWNRKSRHPASSRTMSSCSTQASKSAMIPWSSQALWKSMNHC
ncbi:hypothetical protein [Bifidobacterium breve]|jgi:2-oxo-4-hydroxy-4-carboxy--5-ureidoimidazoline (OHCU) decarboxylase|uniref:hypothetical protein n=1 Tax=Bifidobacterium breve TaxID=1685 RepID=UPI000CA0CD49|nr:hypothetical protein [Bifidobacterium breve]AUD94918.1 hypothetical protein BB017W439_0600 [Bifidobacterium breve]